MDNFWRTIIWQQFGAAIDMLDHALRAVLDESHEGFQQLLAVVEGLPEDIRIEQVHQGTRVYHLVWLDGQRFQPGEFFDHFHDDHEPDIRVWLARVEK